jgi:predicted MFS family arabinose efflux permease
MWLLPDGPYQKRMQRLDFSAFFKVFRDQDFRAAAFGYFGHMWELYAFWAFVPLILAAYLKRHPGLTLSVSLWSFIIIGIGGVACVMGGYLSRAFGEKKVAAVSLSLSGGCCLLLPWAITWGQPVLFLGYLMVWGMTVIADSPLFSTLVARNAGKDRKGTALTIVTCIGFAITILSIEALGTLSKLGEHPANYLILSLGPILGLLALRGGRPGWVTRHP